MYNGRLVKGWRAAQSFCRVCPNVGEVHFFSCQTLSPPYVRQLWGALSLQVNVSSGLVMLNAWRLSAFPVVGYFGPSWNACCSANTARLIYWSFMSATNCINAHPAIIEQYYYSFGVFLATQPSPAFTLLLPLFCSPPTPEKSVWLLVVKNNVHQLVPNCISLLLHHWKQLLFLPEMSVNENRMFQKHKGCGSKQLWKKLKCPVEHLCRYQMYSPC